MSEDSALIRFSEAWKILAKADTLPKVMGVMDMAKAASAYAKAAKLGLDAQNEAAEIKITAERKAGEMLRAIPGAQGKRNDLTSPQDATKLSYEELGIERTEAHRWKKMALLPDDEFKKYLKNTRSSRKEITSVAVYGLSRQYEKNPEGITWNKPDAAHTPKEEAYEEIMLAATIQAIRDAATGEFGDEPSDWLLLDNDFTPILERNGINYNLVTDWVNSGCKTTPLHESIIEIMQAQWNRGKDDREKNEWGKSEF